MTNKEYIDEALNRDVDLSASEYREKCELADKATAAHGVDGKAPVSESVRHKRMQSNFYGTTLNVMLSILAELSRTNELLSDIAMISHIGMTPAQKAQYEQLMRNKG